MSVTEKPDVPGAVEGEGHEGHEPSLDDAACAQNPHKIGPDADHVAGGCDNVQARITAGSVKASYARISD